MMEAGKRTPQAAWEAERGPARRGGSRIRIALHLWFAIVSLSALFPFYTVAIGSLGTPNGMLRPIAFTLEGYKLIIDYGAGRAFAVSVAVTAAGTVLSLAVTTLAAYALARREVPGRGILMAFILFTMFFGGGLIPYYLTVKSVGLYDSYWVMILPSAVNTFYLWVMLSFFRSYPSGLEEAARIDGAGPVMTLLRIVVPTSMPLIASISLFYAVDRWNDWYTPMLFVADPDKYPLQLMLKSLLTSINQVLSLNVGASAIDQSKLRIPQDSLKMAAIVIASVPIMAVYPFLQRYLAKGVMVGSIKG